MRARIAAVVLLTATSLAGCSSSAKTTPASHDTTPSTQAVVSTSAASGGGVGTANATLCANLETASQKLASVGSSLTDPASAKVALDDEITLLKDIGKGAPSNVSAAVNDLINLLKGAETALTNPSDANDASLQQLASKMSTDGETIATYLASDCAGVH